MVVLLVEVEFDVIFTVEGVVVGAAASEGGVGGRRDARVAGAVGGASVGARASMVIDLSFSALTEGLLAKARKMEVLPGTLGVRLVPRAALLAWARGCA